MGTSTVLSSPRFSLQRVFLSASSQVDVLEVELARGVSVVHHETCHLRGVHGRIDQFHLLQRVKFQWSQRWPCLFAMWLGPC